MPEQVKLARTEVLRELNLSEDTLSLYEHELELSTSTSSSPLENFTSEEVESIKLFHKLRESGLTYNEIKLLTSFAGFLKGVDVDEIKDIKNLLALSPIYRLKQSLNLARQELNILKGKIGELEETLQKEVEDKSQTSNEDIAILKSELEVKQKALNNLDRKLAETLQQKIELQNQLALYTSSGPIPYPPVKGKKAKELSKALMQKELEINELKKKNDEILSELQEISNEKNELQERLELIEDEVQEMGFEVEERYQEQISSLRDQIETLVERKQKEWETYYTESNEQHRKELLTLQKKHEQEILRLKQKIREQIEELNEIKASRNPLYALSKIANKLR